MAPRDSSHDKPVTIIIKFLESRRVRVKGMFVARVKACQVRAGLPSRQPDGLPLRWPQAGPIAKSSPLFIWVCASCWVRKKNNDSNNNDLLWQRGEGA